MSASLIGRLRSSTASMSLAGSCFSSESAPGPFHHGIEDEAEQSVERPCRQSNGQNQADIRTHLIHRPARDIFPPFGGSRVSSYRIDLMCRSGCGCLLPGPAELGAVNPNNSSGSGGQGLTGECTGQRHPAKSWRCSSGASDGLCATRRVATFLELPSAKVISRSILMLFGSSNGSNSWLALPSNPKPTRSRHCARWLALPPPRSVVVHHLALLICKSRARTDRAY